MNGYQGAERRESCVKNCIHAQQSQRALPRVYFFSSWSALIVVGIAFGAWHQSSMDKLRVDFNSREMVHKIQVSERITDANLAYQQDVERFIRAVGENRVAISNLQTSINKAQVAQGKVMALQNLILKRVGLDSPENHIN
jgi:hypothetical protein